MVKYFNLVEISITLLYIISKTRGQKTELLNPISNLTQSETSHFKSVDLCAIRRFYDEQGITKHGMFNIYSKKFINYFSLLLKEDITSVITFQICLKYSLPNFILKNCKDVNEVNSCLNAAEKPKEHPLGNVVGTLLPDLTKIFRSSLLDSTTDVVGGIMSSASGGASTIVETIKDYTVNPVINQLTGRISCLTDKLMSVMIEKAKKALLQNIAQSFGTTSNISSTNC